MLNGLGLFEGIGGFSLALDPWVRTIAYCERDAHAQSVLLSRMHSGELHLAPIHDNIETVTGDEFQDGIDLIHAGFPCQGISVAGTGKGLEDKRSGLFVHIIRLAEKIRPAFIFLENSPAIRTRGLYVVLRELSAIGYDARWTIVSAEEVGAPHRRERFFLLAHPDRKRLWNGGKRKPKGKAEADNFLEHNGSKESLAHADRIWESPGTQERDHERHGIVDSSEVVADTERERLERQRTITGESEESESWYSGASIPDADGINGDDGGYGAGEAFEQKPTSLSKEYWDIEPNVGRVVNGLPRRMDRLKRLGNAVVPLQAQTAFKRLIGLTK